LNITIHWHNLDLNHKQINQVSQKIVAKN